MPPGGDRCKHVYAVGEAGLGLERGLGGCLVGCCLGLWTSAGMCVFSDMVWVVCVCIDYGVVLCGGGGVWTQGLGRWCFFDPFKRRDLFVCAVGLVVCALEPRGKVCCARLCS